MCEFLRDSFRLLHVSCDVRFASEQLAASQEFQSMSSKVPCMGFLVYECTYILGICLWPLLSLGWCPRPVTQSFTPVACHGHLSKHGRVIPRQDRRELDSVITADGRPLILGFLEQSSGSQEYALNFAPSRYLTGGIQQYVNYVLATTALLYRAPFSFTHVQHTRSVVSCDTMYRYTFGHKAH